MPNRRRIVGIVIPTWWMLVIVVPLCTIVLWVALDQTNKAQDSAQNRANQQFRQALIVTDRKFRQALAVTTRQFSYSINKSVCGFRGFVNPTLKSYEAAAKDPTLSSSARARNDKRIQTTKAFLDTQVTVPANFDCTTLPKRPPKP
jgi:hypothetical protein